ncbi:MAG: threonine synthase, partial [Syntrophales bacterium]
PVKKLVMPTNENDEFPKFMETGVYKKISPSRACLSSAMNVGHPSNLARFFDLYGGIVDRVGAVHRYPDLNEMRRWIFSVSVTDEETRKTIRRAYDQYKVLLEPHGAVGWRGLEAYLEGYGDFSLCVSIETAHPAKFPDELEDLLGVSPELPESMKGIDQKKGEPFELSAGYEEFKNYLKSHLQVRA